MSSIKYNLTRENIKELINKASSLTIDENVLNKLLSMYYSKRILITGSRNYSDRKVFKKVFSKLDKKFLPNETLIIHGDCRGSDKIGGDVAEKLGYDIARYPADWNKYNRAAGPIRNKIMVDLLNKNIDIVLAFKHTIKEDKSGTDNTITLARKRGLNIYYCSIEGELIDISIDIDIVEFYDSIKNEYIEFSNFARREVTLYNVTYPTSEHCYQALKICNKDFGEGTPKDMGSKKDREWYRDKIIKANTPYKTKVLGHQKLLGAYSHKWYLCENDKTLLSDIIQESKKRGIKYRQDWDLIKDRVMYIIVKAKFEQHDDLKELLISTKDREIRESSPSDYYWGSGKDNSGKNILGKILMKIRKELIKN